MSTESRGDWYRVVSGLMRRCAYFTDGRRQIVSFLYPGDLFGFMLSPAPRRFTTEAVVRGTVFARYPRRAVEQLVLADPRAGDQLRSIALQRIHQMEARLLILGRMTAAERVSSFLLELAQRAPTGSERFGLVMSRYDIADYLALSVETVSRTLSLLQQRGVITLPTAHQFEISDRGALAAT